MHEYFSNEEVSRYEDFWPMTAEEVREMPSEWKDMDNRMAVVRHLTEDLRVKEIWGDCDERNIASANVMKRIGFKHVKTEDDSYKEDADGNSIGIRSMVFQYAP